MPIEQNNKPKYLATGNSIYNLNYKLVIITKNRKKLLNNNIINTFSEIIKNILEKNNGSLLNIAGEEDNIQILFEINPVTSLTKLINSVKTVSSRILRKTYNLESLNKEKLGKLWDPSYLILTVGENDSEIIYKYIQNQGNKFQPPKISL